MKKEIKYVCKKKISDFSKGVINKYYIFDNYFNIHEIDKDTYYNLELPLLNISKYKPSWDLYKKQSISENTIIMISILLGCMSILILSSILIGLFIST